MDPERDLVSVDLGDNRTVLVQVRAPAHTEEDVPALGKLPFKQVAHSIDAITEQVQAALARAKPKRATVEFGLDNGRH